MWGRIGWFDAFLKCPILYGKVQVQEHRQLSHSMQLGSSLGQLFPVPFFSLEPQLMGWHHPHTESFFPSLLILSGISPTDMLRDVSPRWLKTLFHWQRRWTVPVSTTRILPKNPTVTNTVWLFLTKSTQMPMWMAFKQWIVMWHYRCHKTWANPKAKSLKC